MSFYKSPRSYSKDENWESCDHCKLGNFGKMHEMQSEQTWNSRLMGLTFDVQICSQYVKIPLNPLIYFLWFLFLLFEFLFI